MAYNFLPAERDQLYLMPPSVTDWLEEGHLAFFLLDVVDQLDLSGFYENLRGARSRFGSPSGRKCLPGRIDDAVEHADVGSWTRKD